MLKGHTKIELTNVNTGEVEVIEEDNMVTNAVSEIFQPLGDIFGQNSLLLTSYASNIYNTMGGILLFDKNIDENVNTFFAPADAKCVGCGAYNALSANNTRGSYNSNESKYDYANKSFKMVFDFTTNQANGDIACVCLTSKAGGYNSYGGDASSTQNAPILAKRTEGNIYNYLTSSLEPTSSSFSDSKEYPAFIDLENGYIYYFKIKNSTTLSIIKRRCWAKDISLFDTLYQTLPPIISEKDYTIKTNILGYGYYNYDVDADKFYIISSGSNSISSGSNITVTIYDVAKDTVEQTTFVNPADTTIHNEYSVIHNGKLVVRGYNVAKWYVIDLENPTIVKNVTGAVPNDNAVRYAFARNGRIWYAIFNPTYSYGYVYVLNLNDNVCQFAETSGVTSSNLSYKTLEIRHQPLILGWWNSTYYRFYGNMLNCNNYLATINNLSSPVTKTSDKTMKITYTLQEVQ